MGVNTIEHQTDQRVARYESALSTDEQRIALNSLTAARIEEARARNKEKRFITKGVDHLGSAKNFLVHSAYYGPEDLRTKAAERMFDYDVLTGLFEETESVFAFSVEYPIVDGRVMMGGSEWGDLAANGATDENSDDWYQARAFAETREAILVGESITDGTLEEHDIVTISNTSTAANAGDYFARKHLMVRHISLDKAKNTLRIDQLMMHHLDVDIIQNLFHKLKVEVDNDTLTDTDDKAAPHLATQIKVNKGELKHLAADVGFLVDAVATEATGQQHLFGKVVEQIKGNPYAEIFARSRQKEARRADAVNELKIRLCELARQQPPDIKTQLRLAFEEARSQVADMEGVDYVQERYGSSAAKDYVRKQQAAAKGDWAAVQSAEHSMQHSMGEVGSCMSVLGADENNTNNPNDVNCERLPVPGEIARCPSCRRSTKVAGTKEAIKCSEANCKLEDAALRTKRLRHQERNKKLATIAKLKKKHNALKSKNNKGTKPEQSQQKLRAVGKSAGTTTVHRETMKQ